MRKHSDWIVGLGLLAGVVALVCGMTTGCSKPKDSAATAEVSEMAKLYAEVTQILSKVNDRPTAEAAKPKLLELAGRIKKHKEDEAQRDEEIKKAGKRLPTLSDAQKKVGTDVVEKYKQQFERVRPLDGGKDLLDAFNAATIPKAKG